MFACLCTGVVRAFGIGALSAVELLEGKVCVIVEALAL